RVMTLLQLETPFDAESPRWITVTAPPQLSEAVTDPMFGGGTSEKHWTETGPAHVIDGAVVSFTVMIWVQVAKLPQASVALYVRVITVLQLDTPFEAESPTWITLTAPPQLSEAVTDPMFGGGTSEKHWTETGPGHEIDGAVVSCTVIVWPELTAPFGVGAVQVLVIVPPHGPPTSGPSLEVTVGGGHPVAEPPAKLG